MKVFLTFMALLIVNVNMMVFHDDLRVYKNIKESVVTAAESCAHGSSMYFNAESYAEGILVFDAQQAGELADDVIKRCEENDKYGCIKNFDVMLRFFDENGICRVIQNGEEVSSFNFEFPYYEAANAAGAGDGAQGETLVINEPSVEVFISAEIEDPFRQPFIKANDVTGHCIYGNMPL